MEASNVHLVEKQRDQIEIMLNEKKNLKDIASTLVRDPRDVSYEIKTHRKLYNRANKKIFVVSRLNVLKCTYVIHVSLVNANIVDTETVMIYANSLLLIPLFQIAKLEKFYLNYFIANLEEAIKKERVKKSFTF